MREPQAYIACPRRADHRLPAVVARPIGEVLPEALGPELQRALDSEGIDTRHLSAPQRLGVGTRWQRRQDEVLGTGAYATATTSRGLCLSGGLEETATWLQREGVLSLCLLHQEEQQQSEEGKAAPRHGRLGGGLK